MTKESIKLKFKVGDLENILPELLKETLGINSYIENCGDRTQLETPGDINDLLKLMSHKINWVTEPFGLQERKPDPLKSFIEFYKFTQACWGVLSYEEWKALPITKENYMTYPNLTETAAIHAWG